MKNHKALWGFYGLWNKELIRIYLTFKDGENKNHNYGCHFLECQIILKVNRQANYSFYFVNRSLWGIHFYVRYVRSQRGKVTGVLLEVTTNKQDSVVASDSPMSAISGDCGGFLLLQLGNLGRYDFQIYIHLSFRRGILSSLTFKSFF